MAAVPDHHGARSVLQGLDNPDLSAPAAEHVEFEDSRQLVEAILLRLVDGDPSRHGWPRGDEGAHAAA